MPTEPVGRTLPADEPYRARHIAESFGSEAERYERARPAYPDDMVDAILAASRGRDVLDVGIGTGISARPFRQRGCRVLGVEPDQRMAEVARSHGLQVEIARFEEWSPEGRTFDVVTAGQSWHWVDPVGGAAKAAAVLRTGGRIALFWNAMSFPPAFAELFSAVYRRVLPGFPFFGNGAPGGVPAYSPILDNAAAGLRQTGAFDEPERWQFDWEMPYTTAEWLDAVPTFGGHSHIPSAKLTELLEGIGDVLDRAGGSFAMGYTAVVLTAPRVGQA